MWVNTCVCVCVQNPYFTERELTLRLRPDRCNPKMPQVPACLANIPDTKCPHGTTLLVTDPARSEAVRQSAALSFCSMFSLSCCASLQMYTTGLGGLFDNDLKLLTASGGAGKGAKKAPPNPLDKVAQHQIREAAARGHTGPLSRPAPPNVER